MKFSAAFLDTELAIVSMSRMSSLVRALRRRRRRPPPRAASRRAAAARGPAPDNPAEARSSDPAPPGRKGSKISPIRSSALSMKFATTSGPSFSSLIAKAAAVRACSTAWRPKAAVNRRSPGNLSAKGNSSPWATPGLYLFFTCSLPALYRNDIVTIPLRGCQASLNGPTVVSPVRRGGSAYESARVPSRWHGPPERGALCDGGPCRPLPRLQTAIRETPSGQN